ncbi:MAG TPA: EamA family transporter [Thermoleophilaceae bacterium]|nr:EamA family transporter [Thermoleophilaceae bacterium]
MLAIVGGLGAALVFATVTLCNSRSSRMIGPSHLLAWVMLIGLAIVAPLVVLEGVPDGLDAESGAWLAVAGVGNVVGLLLAYAALRVGKVGIVAPVIATQGAVAAVLAVVAGESIGAAAGVCLAAIAVGVVLAGLSNEAAEEGLGAAGDGEGAGPRSAGGGEGAGPRSAGALEQRRALLYALGAAFAIGWSLYATARASIDLPVVWALLPSRVIGVAAVTVPLVLRSGLRMTREALPLVLVAGAFEVLGFALFALGARHGIAVSAVLASQFAAVAAVAAYFLFGERLARIQLAGVALIVVGVGVLSAVEA